MTGLSSPNHFVSLSSWTSFRDLIPGGGSTEDRMDPVWSSHAEFRLSSEILMSCSRACYTRAAKRSSTMEPEFLETFGQVRLPSILCRQPQSWIWNSVCYIKEVLRNLVGYMNASLVRYMSHRYTYEQALDNHIGVTGDTTYTSASMLKLSHRDVDGAIYLSDHQAFQPTTFNPLHRVF